MRGAELEAGADDTSFAHRDNMRARARVCVCVCVCAVQSRPPISGHISTYLGSGYVSWWHV